MPEQVRVGVVGTGGWAGELHLPALRSHPRARLAAICGRNRERAEELAGKHEIPAVFADYREMIDRGGLDALVVSVPDDLHYPVTMAALDAGLHVMCEKPLAMNAGQAREMLDRAESAGVRHMVHFTWRWLPHARYVRELLDEGYVGRCYHCDFRFLFGYARRSRYAWRFDQRRANGVLGDLGSHMIDLARWYVGDIARVSAHLATPVGRSGPDPDGQDAKPANETALLAVEFVDGTQGAIQVSGLAHLADRELEQPFRLYGEAGTLEVDYPFWQGAEVRGARADEKRLAPLEIPERFYEGVSRGEVYGRWPPSPVFQSQPVGDRLFIDSIVDDRPASPSLYDGWKAQEVADAAIESHRERRWVTV